MSETPDQHGRAWLRTATPEQVAAATRTGRLRALLDGHDVDAEPEPDPELAAQPEPTTASIDQGARPPGAQQGTRRWLRGLPADEVRRMTNAGELDGILNEGGDYK